MNIDTDEDFPEHPKTVRFCQLMTNPVGWAYLWKLWRWCAKFQADGDLTAYEVAEVEASVGWTSMDGRFFAAAVRAGFIDQDDRGVRVHNWHRRQGAGLLRIEIDRVRKAVSRARSAGDVAEVTRLEAQVTTLRAQLSEAGTRTSDAGPRDVPRTSDGQTPNGAGPVMDRRRTSDVSALLCSSLPCEGQTRAPDPRDPEPEHAPQPTPLPSLRAVPDPDPDVAGGLTSYDLLQRFGMLWRDRYRLPWAPDREASRAARDLLENQIGALDGEDRAEALADLIPAASRYLDDDSPSLVKNRHPFPWFVDRHNQYRAAPAAQATRTKLKYFEPDNQPK